ncbi:MAG TPA: DUF1736 domain-containing protein [Bacteroidales bacterium]|nr:DUF1736 domain-containing protein [Bacteroidales bacterium]
MKPSAKPKPARKPAIPQKPKKERTWTLFSVVVVVAAGVLYFNTLQNGYVLDDKGIITGNKFTTQGFSGIPDLLTTSYWEGIGINVRSYRPLSPVTFAIEVGLFGLKPGPSHFFNLLLYAMTGLVLLFFLKKLLFRIDPSFPPAVAFLVTLLFLAHPIHTEVVANIKGRDSMLELFFLLLSGYFLLSFLETGKKADLALSVASFFPALLSKESAVAYLVMVPVLLILFDDRPALKKLKTVLPFLLPVALFLLLYYRYSNIGAFVKLHVLDNALMAAPSPSVMLATKLLILGKYLVLLLYPHPLVFDYSYNQIPFTTFSDPLVWISALVYLAAIGYLVFVLVRKLAGKTLTAWQPVAAFSVAWFLMGFAASSNMLMLIGSTMGERFMYSPSLGFLLPGVWLLSKAVFRKGREKKVKEMRVILLYSFCGILFFAYAIATIGRNRAWKDDFTLYSTDIRYLSQNVKANDFLANMYRDFGDKSTDAAQKREFYLKAIELKEKAVAIYPEVMEIQRQLGDLYGKTGQFVKAIGAYKAAIGLNAHDAISHLQIGKAYGMLRQPAEGLKWMKKAEELDPGNADILLALGVTCAQLGDLGNAIPYFEKTLARDPSNSLAARYLDQARRQTGKK